MTAICLLDASVLCELLPVPGKSQAHDQVRAAFDDKKKQGHELFLPFATLIETGNHIGQVSDSRLRVQTAQKFGGIVHDAIDASEPCQLFRIPDRNYLAKWLDALPSWVQVKGSGIGDLSIKIEWERLCRANRKRRVYVWSLDEHLQGLDSVRR